MAENKRSIESIAPLQLDIEKKLNHFIPILETEIQQMELFISKNIVK